MQIITNTYRLTHEIHTQLYNKCLNTQHIHLQIIKITTYIRTHTIHTQTYNTYMTYRTYTYKNNIIYIYTNKHNAYAHIQQRH